MKTDSPMTLSSRLEEADTILNEAQAIFAFIDEATVSMSRTDSRFIDDIHRESDYGMHLCFITGLELMTKAREVILPTEKEA